MELQTRALLILLIVCPHGNSQISKQPKSGNITADNESETQLGMSNILFVFAF